MAGERPPALQPVRRNPRVGPVILPAEGRQGDPPKWPLPGTVGLAERDLWITLWATPQAVMWERLGAGGIQVVARYCKLSTIGSLELDPRVLAEVRQLEDRLGLTPKAMRQLLWKISEDEVAEKREDNERQTKAAQSDARKRFKAIG